MTTKTFTVVVDYATLSGAGASEKVGKVTFSPRFSGNSAWTTDGTRIVDAQPVTLDVTSAGGPQNFVLGHPDGWLVGFTWVVSAVIDGRTVLGPQPIRTPAPNSVTALPALLDVVPSVPGATVTMQSLVVPTAVPDGWPLVKDGAAIVGLDPADFGGGAVDSVNGKTGPVTLTAADVGARPSSYVPAWTDVTDKPTTFAPSAHTTALVTDFSTAVDARIQNVVGAAPAALNTLDELAQALGDDANFAATVTTELAGKVSTTTVPSINAGPIANRPATPVAGSLYIEVILP